MKKVKILGVSFDAVSTDEALRKIADLFESRRHERGKLVVTPNPEMLLIAQKNHQFRDVLNQAYLSIPDGIGILWASTFQEITKQNRRAIIVLVKALFSLMAILVFPRYCSKVFPERVTGTDLVEKIAEKSRNWNSGNVDGSNGASIFLLGAQEGIAEKVREKLEKKYPGVKIGGTHAGSPWPQDFPTIEEKITKSAAQILLVAYGQEKQEFWLARHLAKFPSVRVAIGVGGAFDFIAGARKRAPRWMQRLGIEWLFRLAQEPTRIRRIYHAIVKFPMTVIWNRFRPAGS